MVKRYHPVLARRLGQNIAHYRRRAGLTQEQLAEAIQVEAATISRYETGATLPSLVTLETVSALLRVSITDLLAEEAFPRTDEGEQFLVMLESLSPDERSVVMKMLTTFVDFLRKQRFTPEKRLR